MKKWKLFRRHNLWSAPCCLTLPPFSRVKTVKGEGKKNYLGYSLSAFNLCGAAMALNAYRIEFRGQGLLVSKKHKLVCGGKEKKSIKLPWQQQLRAQITYYSSWRCCRFEQITVVRIAYIVQKICSFFTLKREWCKFCFLNEDHFRFETDIV